MASNPRIDDLRRRLGKEPRLFAQLAEELRKEGELAEAIRVCREGLSRNPNYPSARITLGRALLDSGNTAGARGELEAALKGAPDNILAGRLLAECLEALGESEAALARYRATLLLAPGDRQIQGRISELELRSQGGSRPGEGKPVPPGPIPVAEVDEPMELEISEAPLPSLPAVFAEPASPGTPSVAEGSDEEMLAEPLLPVEDESFELESAYDAPATHWTTHQAAPVEPVSLPPPRAPVPALEPPPAVLSAPTALPAPVIVSAPAALPVPAAELNTPTLAEIYASQGLLDKAMAVYRQILERDGHDERARARLAELEQERARGVPAAAGRPAIHPGRRAAIERTIGRMEMWLAALHRAAP